MREFIEQGAFPAETNRKMEKKTRKTENAR